VPIVPLNCIASFAASLLLIAAATNAVVAIAVELSVASATVGALGVPVNVGDAKRAIDSGMSSVTNALKSGAAAAPLSGPARTKCALFVPYGFCVSP